MQDKIERRVMVCPLNGKICSNGIREDFPEDQQTKQKLVCRWWVHIQGKDPQSETLLDQFDCSMAWMPILQIEGAQATRMANASVDKVANQINKLHGSFVQALPEPAKERLGYE